jgi:threonine/homoserine/homoserine lactone efflux protein
MITGSHFTAFLLASLALALTPGPGVIYIVTRSLADGRRAGLASAGGVACGNLGAALAATVGLAALLALSTWAFAIGKYAGAAYLVYLGVQILRARPSEGAAAHVRSAPVSRVFRDGCLVALLNPKTALFFAAFLPQFIDPEAATFRQSLLLASVFVAIAAVTDTLYALLAGTLAPLLGRARAARDGGRYLAGGTLIGLGILAAASSTRSAK